VARAGRTVGPGCVRRVARDACSWRSRGVTHRRDDTLCGAGDANRENSRALGAKSESLPVWTSHRTICQIETGGHPRPTGYPSTGRGSLSHFIRDALPPGSGPHTGERFSSIELAPARVKLMPEYGVDIPLWPRADSTDSLVPAELLRRLESWQTDFDDNFLAESGWKTEEAKGRWALQAVTLKVELRADLAGKTEREVDLWPLGHDDADGG
jgi:hypothetical protein